MAVHAHPDDESSKGAATTARYAAEGVDVLIVTCTGGERGDVLNPSYVVPEGHEFDTIEGKRAVRRLEMAASAAALGVRQEWLGFVDSGLPEGDPLPPLPEGCFALTPLEEAAAPLVEAVRRFRPHVITTYDPSGGYPHPDHVYTHTVTMEAWQAAGDPGRYVVDGGAPAWEPLKLYYNHGFSIERIRAVHARLVERGLESPFGSWIETREAREVPEREVTTRIEVADWFPQRDAALRAHASQIDPEGFFFAVPREVEREVWRTEEYELAESRVATSLPEDDLFAGIRGTEVAR
ncbi:mycothiol conjugate amidase Mca [Puerhibacterium sp. TATVAM-FAB25]|uniref:mycothiol conjugate amidase Mca n=1 Tax=Puerhibacterium sp. TATVAM-FAB25 TaxID=3093699 RepID=UPI00397E72EF